MSMKKCKTCEEIKPDYHFYDNRRVCQGCYKKRQTEYYVNNREKVKQRSLRRYHDSKPK